MNLRNLILDIITLVLFVLTAAQKLFSETIHEWLGVAWIVAIIIHLVIHWDWIVNVGKQYFKKLWHISRLKFLVDVLAFLSFVAVGLSGLLISRSVLPTLGIQLAQTSRTWESLHKLIADASVLLIGLHFAFNWGWVMNTFKRYIFSPIVKRFGSRKNAPQAMPLVLDDKQ